MPPMRIVELIAAALPGELSVSFLYAGAIRPHKNVVRIIEAFSALKSELHKEQQFTDLKLIIIGDDLSEPSAVATYGGARRGAERCAISWICADRGAADFLRCREDFCVSVAI